MPEKILIEKLRTNRPLVEVSIALADGVKSDEVLCQLNELADHQAWAAINKGSGFSIHA